MFGFLKNVSRGPAANMANIAVPPTPQNVMTGPVEYKVYVYDNRPLLRIPPGHRFLTGIVRQRAILTSALTDTEYDTADGGYALAYNGAIFGVLSSWKLCDYLDRYGFVYIECVWNQWYDFPHRFPLVVALGRELKNGADIGAVFHKTVSKHSPVIERLLNGIPEATLPAEVTALPVPKGSQAKPHVAITVGGETICEIGARSWDYTNLASLVGMRGGVRLQRWVSRYEDDDDGYYYVIDLIR